MMAKVQKFNNSNSGYDFFYISLRVSSIEYPHRSSERNRKQGYENLVSGDITLGHNPVPGGITGPPYSWGI
jgi:hypothetical protein